MNLYSTPATMDVTHSARVKQPDLKGHDLANAVQIHRTQPLSLSAAYEEAHMDFSLFTAEEDPC